MAKPLLKWAGGKRKVLPKLQAIIDENSNSIDFENADFYDVFGGGGSVGIHFHSRFCNIIFNDTNDELINLYKVIRDNPNELINLLCEHEKNNNKEHYYRIRERDRRQDFKNSDHVAIAARTLYLNRVCFNGLYRLNRKGYFNVPYGKYKNPLICDYDNIKELNQIFNHKFLFKNDDFQTVIEEVKKGDVVYLDPPYDQEVAQSFVSYTSDGFNRKDQVRLKHCVDILTERGAYVILSNSATDFIVELYRDYIQPDSIIYVGRSISAKNTSRIPAKEILINNFGKVIYENKNCSSKGSDYTSS